MSRPPRRDPRGGPTTAVTAALLRDWRLPDPDAAGDKRTRGMLVCVGGSAELPGAMLLAGLAALRAGAGTVRLGVPRHISLALGVALPEALVFGLPTTRDGAIAPPAAALVAERAMQAAAVLVGPGMVGRSASPRLLEALLPELGDDGVLVLDALALDGAARARHAVRACRRQTIMTPHTGEMARLLGVDRERVEDEPLEFARQAADAFGSVVALKGPRTLIVAPDGAAYCYTEGHVGLATSGSGDTLAGMIAGLAARGADALQASVWGVYLHGSAGNRLARQVGRLGFLARELPDQVPPILAELAQGARSD